MDCKNIADTTPIKRRSILSNSSAIPIKDTANSIRYWTPSTLLQLLTLVRRVICRFRPPKASEVQNHGQSDKVEIYDIDQTRGTVAIDVDFEKKNFTFDEVFGVEATQAEVYFFSLLPVRWQYVKIFDSVVGIIDSVMEGFNGTILAYGQTSSGNHE
jgi:hypothetical protein